MEASLVLTIIGPDKPGLVEAVAEKVVEHGGSWQESRMARLAGRFAGILQVSVAEARADALSAALRSLETAGLNIVVERSAVEAPAEAMRRLRLDLIGNDREGIVRVLSKILASHGVNVERLRTECVDAPVSGGQLFKATAELGVPPSVNLDALREVLEDVANELMVDISLDSAEAMPATSLVAS